MSEIIYKNLSNPDNPIEVVREGDTLTLRYTRGAQVYSTYDKTRLFTGRVWDYFIVGPLLAGRTDDILIIGLGGGTTLRQFSCFFDASFDVVEVDEQIVGVARKYFNVRETDGVRIFVDDGRHFLENTDKKYDVILVDAFYGTNVPSHMISREFFTLNSVHLRDGGVLVMNTTTGDRDTVICRRICDMIDGIFPSVYVIPYGGNNVVAAMKNRVDVRWVGEKLGGEVKPDLRGLTEKIKNKIMAYKKGMKL